MVTRYSARPVRRIITVADAEKYGRRGDDEQRDLQNRMAEVQDLAARNAGLDRPRAFTQGTGDGSITAWPPEASDLDLLVDYLRELHHELIRVNRTLARQSRIRLRLAISAGIVEEASQGITGQAVIRATLLANSDKVREALRKAPGCPLAVILDGALYEDVVLTGRRTLRDAAYERVIIRDKYGQEHVAWITVPGSRRRSKAPVPSGPPGGSRDPAGAGRAEPAEAGRPAAPGGARRKRRLPIPVIAALIGAAAVIAAAVITAPGPSVGVPSPTVSASGGGTSAAAVSLTPVTGPSELPATSPGRGAAGLHEEQADNHHGTDVFRDPLGDVVTSGPVVIPFGTLVLVKCWAPNESGMGSINAFYLVETPPWAGDYAPANTFLNADTTGALDPHVTECPAA